MKRARIGTGHEKEVDLVLHWLVFDDEVPLSISDLVVVRDELLEITMDPGTARTPLRGWRRLSSWKPRKMAANGAHMQLHSLDASHDWPPKLFVEASDGCIR